MRVATLLLLTVLLTPLVARPLHAQRPTLTLSGGIAGQYDGGSDLGSPGVSAAAGLQFSLVGPLALRVEAQGFGYPGQTSPAVFPAVEPSTERAGVIAALASVEPRRGVLYGLAGAAALRARLTNGSDVSSGAAVGGIGVRAGSRIVLEGQYIHAVHPLGSTRSLLAARLMLRL